MNLLSSSLRYAGVLGDTVPPVEWRPHPTGAAGAKVSLEKCAERVRKDYTDPLVVAFARRTLQAAPSATSTRAKAQALLDAMKARARYIPDPVNSEYIASARLILCLDSSQADYCHAGGDCDELTCTLCSLLMAIGIDVVLVGQGFAAGSTVPTHVLLAAFDPQSDSWFKIDPSTSLPVGRSYPSVSEVEVDPLTGAVPDFSQPVDVQFVGVGAPGPLPHSSARLLWAPRLMRTRTGLGATPIDVLSYRNMWNEFVLDTVRCAQSCAQAYSALGGQQTDPTLKADLLDVSTGMNASATQLLNAWNAWANTAPDVILVASSQILQDFQAVVQAAGHLRDQLTTGVLTCSLTYAGPNGPTAAVGVPDTSLQTQVVSALEGANLIAKGVLFIFANGTTTTLMRIGQAANAVVTAATSPWTYVAIAAAGVAAFVVVSRLQAAPAAVARRAVSR